MNNVLILDMGGVLMQHNMPECLSRFRYLLGEEQMNQLLGLDTNGEGTAGSLMDQYERGLINTDEFINAIIPHTRLGTTRQDIINAWLTMHKEIPAERLQLLQQWKKQGYHLFLLSNNNELHWQDIMTHYDMSAFEYCFASHLMHVSKPDIRIYQAVEQYLQQNHLPAPYIFVDDNEINRTVAQSLNWITYPDLDTLTTHLQCPTVKS